MTVFSMLRRAIHCGRARPLGAIAMLALSLAAPPLAWAQDANTTDTLPTRVGRLSALSGEIYLAPQANASDWSPIDLNYPVTNGDNLWTSEGARAEVDFGGSQMRMSASTNVSVSNLDDHNVDLFVAQGDVIVRLNSLAAGDAAVIDTPTTQVVLLRPGLYRIEVSADQQQTTLTIRTGEATAQVSAGLQQVLPGMTAVIANGPTTAAEFSAAYPLDAFDSWSASRERYFRQASTTTYVSPQMVGNADLATYGAWQSYPDYGNVWFPTSVSPGWAPYSDGYWTTVSGFGLTWVDRAPWGYAPFHYGRWAHIGGRWGWCPGNYVARPVWAPALVAWTGGGLSISVSVGGPVYGWVPLGWREPYRPWWGGCGENCWDRYNRPYHVDQHDYDRYRNDQPPPVSAYANWRVPGAVTAVAGAQLIARKPYPASVRVSLTGTALASARPVSSAPPLANLSPNRIPIVRAGSQGTPPPASTFYATSKPAQMGLQHPGTARLVNASRGANASLPNAAGPSTKPLPQNARTPTENSGARTPMENAGTRTPVVKPAPMQSPPPGTRGVGVPATAAPANNAAPRIGAPQNNSVVPSVNGNEPPPRMQTEPRGVNPAPRTQTEPRVVNQAPGMRAEPPVVNQAPRVQAEPRAVNPAPRIQAEPRVVNQVPRTQTESRVVNVPQPPRVQTESRAVNAPQPPRMQNEQRVAPQQVIRAPQVPRGEAVRPAPAAANPHVNANKVETPNAGKGNEDRGRPATKVERDNEQQR